MPDFVHLHNHSDYSLLDGAASIASLIKKAQSLGMKHLALTDHGNMFGAVKFYNACKEAGINPIIGSEFYVAPGSRHIKSGTEKGNRYYHLLLLAKNTKGYQNLMKLSTYGYTEGFYYKPRIDWELLESYREGLICSTACLGGEVPSYILEGKRDKAEETAIRFKELYGPENFYLELQDHGIEGQKKVNRALVEMSKALDIPLIATNDIHYTNKDDANSQDLLLCVGTNKKKQEANRMKFESGEFYMKSGEEMALLFGELPEALKNTSKIAEMCSLDIPMPGPLLPEYSIPRDFDTPELYLNSLAFTGLRNRYSDVTDEMEKRLQYELDVINSMEYTGYFLIVWDFIQYARDNNIPVGPGRGSGAGSLTAYSLGITDIDPLKYGLLFERFLNPERVSMPDFDIDFCYERRQEVIDYVTEKYGKDRVSQIITFGTLKAKAVIRDVARVLDIPYAEADRIAKLVPATLNMTLKKALEMEPELQELREKEGVYRELIDVATRLEGLNRHASTHAAGIVIGKETLTNYVPLYRDPKTESISTQYTMDMLEPCGLVKMDFLGLKTLTIIKNSVKLIRKRVPDFDIEAVPEDDAATFSMLGEGKSTSIFQFESQGMQGILKQAKPTKIEDLIALNALYRPGPMDNIPQFIESKWDPAKITYPHPSLQKVLEETYGVIVYQEQVMEIAQIVGGFSLGQADILRRAMGKKKEKVMATMKQDFLKGAEKRGYSRKEAEKIFELLIPFAGYGFNKSHAAAYSILAYKTAYLKANFPAEFMAANLTNEIHNQDKLSEYIQETRSLNIEILPPNINLSEKYFTVVEGNIVYGLVGVKNVGTAAVDEIILRRSEGGEYSSLFDFLERVDLRVINRKVIETLIVSGLFDHLHSGRATLFHNLDAILEFVGKKKESSLAGQGSLFDPDEYQEMHTLQLEEMEEWPHNELLRYERENLGFFISGHPLDQYREVWEKAVNIDITTPEKYAGKSRRNLIGLIKNVKEIQTKKGDRMAFAELEDYRGSMEIIFFPEIWGKYHYMIQSEQPVGIVGKVDTKRGDPKFIVEEVKKPNELETQSCRELHIKLSIDSWGEDNLVNLRSLLIDHQGTCPVFLHVLDEGTKKEVVVKASSQLLISAEEEVLEKLKSYPKIEEVWRI